MSHRKRRRDRESKSKVKEREQARAEKRKSNLKKLAYVSIVLALVIVFAAIVVQTPPNYMQCFPTGTNLSDRADTMVYIGVGNVSAFKFIHIPDNLGLGSACSWPLQTRSSTSSGERTDHYVKVHTTIPFSHTYTLADFFYVWGEWGGYSGPIYFHGDGVSTYRGHVSVYIFPTEYPDAENLNATAHYMWSGDVRSVPMSPNSWVYIWLQYPYTDGYPATE